VVTANAASETQPMTQDAVCKIKIKRVEIAIQNYASQTCFKGWLQQ